MKHVFGMVVAVLGVAVAAGADEDRPIRPSRCPAMGRGIIMVGHFGDEPGDPNGSAGPWMSPPPPTPLEEGAPPPPPDPSMPPQAARLPVPGLHTDWELGATANFGGSDKTCDLVWTTVVPGERGQPPVRKMALTVTGSDHVLPLFGEPEEGHVFAVVPAEWALLGSGDFVGLRQSSAPAGPPPADGQPDLLLWNASTRAFDVWAADGAGGFPVEQRYAVAGVVPEWTPTVVANIDGQGAPEVIWVEPGTGRMAFSRILAGPTELEARSGRPLSPEEPVDYNWTLRVADDFDGDGRDDLLFQNENSEKAVVWYMDGPTRRLGHMFVPNRLAPETPEFATGRWPIIGPR